MPVGQWSEAAKKFVGALYGDPEMRAQAAQNASNMALNAAKINEANANVAAKQLEAQRLGRQLDAQKNYGDIFVRALAPVDVPPQSLPALNAPVNPAAAGPVQRPAMDIPAYQRAPNQLEINTRLPELLSGALQAGSNPQDIGSILQAFQGQLSNIGENNPIAIRSNTAFGAGKPFSETEMKAQVFGTLPFEQQQRVASAVPTDQVFGGALAQTQTPEQITQTYSNTQKTADQKNYEAGVDNPEFANYMNIQNAVKKPYESTSEKLNAESWGKLQDDLYKKVNLGQETRFYNTQIKQVLQEGIKTGAGSDLGLMARKLALAGNLIDPNSPQADNIGKQELIQSLQGRAALVLRNPEGGGGLTGSTSDRDLSFLLSSVPGLTQTPQGNLKLIEILDRKTQWDENLLEYADSIQAANGGVPPANFRQMLVRFANENPILKPGEREEIDTLAKNTTKTPDQTSVAPADNKLPVQTMRDKQTGRTFDVYVYPDGRMKRVQ